jgi:hypothetical protein
MITFTGLVIFWQINMPAGIGLFYAGEERDSMAVFPHGSIRRRHDRHRARAVDGQAPGAAQGTRAGLGLAMLVGAPIVMLLSE